MKPYILASIVIVAVIITTAFILPKNQEQPPIKIAISDWVGYSHAFVARDKGFFEKNDVKVELVYATSYSEAQSLYRKGQVHGVFEAYADTIFHNSEGIPSEAVYIADISYTSDAIVGLPVESLSDLKGKSVGIEGLNTFSHIFVLTALEKSGLTQNDVNFVQVSAFDVDEALKNGNIVAGHTWNPVKDDLVGDGFSVLCTAGDIPGIISDVMVFDQQTIESRPDDIKKIVKSILEAQDFMYTDSEEAATIIEKAGMMKKEDVMPSLSELKQLTLEEQIVSMTSPESDSLVSSGNIIKTFYDNREQLSVDVDITKVLNESFLQAIADNK
jgi:NitT/TauT family transport system substrate-binding protein